MGERGKFKGHLATVLVLSAIALVVLLALLKMSGFLSVGGTYKVRAVVPQAGSLTQGTSVTMAGVRVGTVLSVERRGVGALVNIRIDEKDVTPLPANSKAQLGVRTPLGENYVEILPGNSQQDLPKDGILPVSDQNEYVDVDQILSTLRGRTRDRARDMVGGLATAVRGEGESLNSTLSHAASVLHSGSALERTLYPDRQRIALLVQQLGDITREIGDREGSIRAIATQGKITFGAIASRDDQLRQLVDVLPSTLDQVRTTTSTIGSLSDAGAPVIANLAVALRDVQPAVRTLPAAASEGRAVIRSLSAAAPPLTNTLNAVTRLAPRLVPTAPKLQKALCQLNPGLRYLKPYTRDVLSLIEGFGSASNSYDAIGHTIRLQPLLGENSAFAEPDAVSQAQYELINKGVFGAQNGTGFRPYPKPGEANDALQASDKFSGPEAYAAQSGYQYPHLKPDC